MKYAKLINNYIKYAPNPINVDDNWYGNPPAEIYSEQGYKPVIYTNQPEPQGYGYYTETWTETPTSIVQGWEWVENDEVDPTEAMEILFGGDNL